MLETKWWSSSTDPAKVSLTIKGLVVFAPALVMLGTVFGFTFDIDTLGQLINEVAVVGAGLVTIYGLLRKLGK